MIENYSKKQIAALCLYDIQSEKKACEHKGKFRYFCS